MAPGKIREGAGKVVPHDPAGPNSNTSSDIEEEFRNRMWGDTGTQRRKYLETYSPDGPRRSDGDGAPQKRPNAYNFDDDYDNKEDRKGGEIKRSRPPSISSSTSSEGSASAQDVGRKRKSAQFEQKHTQWRTYRILRNVLVRKKPGHLYECKSTMGSIVGNDRIGGEMAGPTREMMGNKDGKGGNPEGDTLRQFAIFAMRGFGGFKRMIDVGCYGDAAVASVKRCINERRNTLIAAGIRFRITNRLLGEAVKAGGVDP